MSARPAFPTVRVGDPIRHEALTIFPLFAEVPPASAVEYLLSDEAIASGTVVVEEVGESGSVPTLVVTNRGNHRVLFLEGEELRGAKQNRILNTTVLIGAVSKVTIPVSCVEQGRWHFRTRAFSSSDSHASPKLRKRLKESLMRSLRLGQGHQSDQGAVWEEVSRQMTSLGSSSDTMAMADTYESHRAHVDDFRKVMGYVQGATGLAVAIGPRVAAMDLFDRSETCRKVWDRLLSGYIMEALEARASKAEAVPAEVDHLLARLTQAPWQESPAVGEGQEFRAEDGSGTHATALVFQASLLHGSAIADAPVA